MSWAWLCNWIGHRSLVLSNETQSRQVIARKILVTQHWDESCPRCGKRWRCRQPEGLMTGPGKVTRTEVPTWS